MGRGGGGCCFQLALICQTRLQTAHKRKDDGGKPGARKGRAQADSSDDEEDEEDEVDEEDSDAEEQPKKRSRKVWG